MRSLLITLFVTTALPLLAQKKTLYHLDSTRDNMNAFIKMRASLNESEEVVFYASGSIYAYLPGKPWKHLFDFEMYNIARAQKMAGDSGWYLLSREMLIYKDPVSHERLTRWKNQITGDTVEVIPVWNDPVNQVFRYGKTFFDYERTADGQINFYNDITLTYPSPLKKADWPVYSRSDLYQGAELFNFYCSEKDLQNKKRESVSANFSWTRFSDFLPWMKMADAPGNLLYQGRGYKLKKGWQDLPEHIKEIVRNENPVYEHAPLTFTSPNMTSWKYFRQLMEERRKLNK